MSLNPLKANKVDVKSLTPEEQKAFKLYGKLPNRNNIFVNKPQERKYFDSGDYALSRAGKEPADNVGSQHPNPASIPHSSHLGQAITTASSISSSPVKESNLAPPDGAIRSPTLRAQDFSHQRAGSLSYHNNPLNLDHEQ